MTTLTWITSWYFKRKKEDKKWTQALFKTNPSFHSCLPVDVKVPLSQQVPTAHVCGHAVTAAFSLGTSVLLGLKAVIPQHHKGRCHTWGNTKIKKHMNILKKCYLLQGFSSPEKVERIYNRGNLSVFLYMKLLPNKIGTNARHSLEQSQPPWLWQCVVGHLLPC